MEKLEIIVKGINCEHCVGRIKNALEPLATNINVDIESKMLTLESDTGAEKLLAALDEAGYPGSLA